ncbi:MAG: glycosyltransferase family 2 protein, partial [Bacteroidaceae bacterium]|nr:glycosyltransferase family 2 protein [Bacteroidaceae bacterium]
MHIPSISISMPAYNAENYICEAIESIMAQTFTDWELIVVDDCSNDKTYSIASKLAEKDNRIRIIKRQENSGSARLPRFDGVIVAHGKYICAIDSDDTIEPEYLQKMINRQKQTQSDIVLGRMRLCNQKLQEDGRMIPKADYDMDKVFCGRESVIATLGSWQIAMGGMLVVSELYKNYARKNYDPQKNTVFADELDQRNLLLSASIVSMADASYFYRQQQGSVIHKINLRRFDQLKDIINYLN